VYELSEIALVLHCCPSSTWSCKTGAIHIYNHGCARLKDAHGLTWEKAVHEGGEVQRILFANNILLVDWK
jgi:hypothetical protein